jgi:hypothetical protein
VLECLSDNERRDHDMQSYYCQAQHGRGFRQLFGSRSRKLVIGTSAAGVTYPVGQLIRVSVAG